MINFQEIEDLININLAGDTKIEPDKHREVEFALLEAIRDLALNSIRILRQGSLEIGNITSSSQQFTINFPDLGTDQYYLLGSLKSQSLNFNEDNNVFWNWSEPKRTSVKINIREMFNNNQNVSFWYMIIPKTF